MDAVKKTKARPRNKPKKTIGKPKSSHLSVRNQYEAGSTGRRLGGWQPGMTGPNSAYLRDLDQLRNRRRDAERNNSYLSRATESWSSNEIGCGIAFKAMSPDPNWNKLADNLWDRQSQFMDAYGQLDFNGMLLMAVVQRRVAGEVFARRRIRRPSDGLPVPLQYQLVEAEYCPHQQNIFGGDFNIRAGIEFNAIGRRTAYWMYREHPADPFPLSSLMSLDLVRVPAESVLHHYVLMRPGQIRGVPEVKSLIKAKDFDEYDDAELVRKKTRSAFTGAIQRPNFDPDTDALFDPLTGEPVSKDVNGVPVTDIQAGQFLSLMPGEQAELFEGDNTGSGYADFVHQQVLGIAAGENVPYEFISGDFSELNDRTLRVVLAEYRRSIEKARWLITIPQLCYPIWRDFINIAVASGALPEPKTTDLVTVRNDTGAYQYNVADIPWEYYKVDCHPEGWDYLHALQDAQSDILRWKNGLTSRKRILAENGEDVRDIDRENQEDQQRADDLGLKYGEDAAAEDPNSQTDNAGY